MRKLTTLKTISDVIDIAGSDFIQVVKFQDSAWQCVAKKSEFQIGDQCLYFEIDSLLPYTNTAFDFLTQSNKATKVDFEGKEYVGYRLKSIKLRGCLSQGLALPIKLFPNIDQQNPELDVQLGIVKYDPLTLVTGDEIGGFHHLVPKTDEERIQNLVEFFGNWKDIEMAATEKLDGTSCTIVYENGLKSIYGRQYQYAVGEGNKYDIATKNIVFPNDFAVQGEVIGESIQGNPYKQNGVSFVAFNVYDLKQNKYMEYREFVEFCSINQIQTTPTIYIGKISKVAQSVEEILAFAEGKSKLSASTEREGLVWRSLTDVVTHSNGYTNSNRISFKTISNKFLLKSKD
jgi:RNA ligase (TIGR02306 family)